MFIENMKCPKCQLPLEAEMNAYQEIDADYLEVEFSCTNEHKYFTRVKIDDLLEAD